MRAAIPAAAGPLFCAALAFPAFGQDVEPAADRAFERRTQEIKESAAPAVVSVTVITRASPLPRIAFPGLVIAPDSRQSERIEGTGFFISSKNLLVTTRDLVADAERIEVRFVDGTVRDATLVGIDEPFRVAVLCTSAPERAVALPHAPRVEVGVSTIGWLLGAAAQGTHAPSIDVQVASVRAAPDQGSVYDRFLYAPISIARGAAGGPLVGSDGNLLGMAVGSLVARDDSATSGVCQRLPRATLFVRGDDIADAARQIAATGAVERPMIGALMQGDTNRIDALLAGSPAEAAGLLEGDAIVAVSGCEIASFADLTHSLMRRHAGDRVKLTVDRSGERFTRCVQLAPYTAPEEPTRPPIDGTVIELTTDAKGDPVLTFVEVHGDSTAGKAGVRAGDRLLSADGRSAWRFLQRHRHRPAVLPPSKIEVERDGKPLEIPFPTE
jgi:S1-C subfamily serine protease